MKKHLDSFALLLQYELELKATGLFQAHFVAENYRKFHVGAAVLAHNGDGLKIFGGANIMNGKGRPKVCAEQQAIKHAFLERYTEILIVSVVGKMQPDKESRIVSPTLHPCADCRKLMRDMYCLSDDALIYTFSFEEDGPTELYPFLKLMELHNTPRPRSRIFSLSLINIPTFSSL